MGKEMPLVSDVDAVIGYAVPVIGAAVAAYGANVLSRVEQEASDATVQLGHQILARILGRAPERSAVEAAVTKLAAYPRDPDALAALRLQIREVLTGDADLAAELAAILPQDAAARVPGFTIGGNVSIKTGNQSAAALVMGNVTVGSPTMPGPTTTD